MSVFKLLTFEPKILATINVKIQASTNTPAIPFENHKRDKVTKIEFKNVTFAYPTNEGQLALEDITLSIRERETTALVGRSGAGKSSILSLIERFYDPSSGHVLFEGDDMRKIGVRQLRNCLAFVPQEAELFPGSIDYNIRLGTNKEVSEVNREKIEEVMKECGLHDFVSSLPQGYNTACSSMSSSNFSGGQRQRLSLARALIRDPEVLLLDEPTSSLDATSEKQVQDALNKASENRTTIIVAHRLASVQNADKIVVFEGGKVVEEGAHAELMQHGGLYASMAKAQGLT